ncbi:pseudouridine synthase [Chloropicon primus]|nr:pseudouridine synthase [Chloropicon primus]
MQRPPEPEPKSNKAAKSSFLLTDTLDFLASAEVVVETRDSTVYRGVLEESSSPLDVLDPPPPNLVSPLGPRVEHIVISGGGAGAAPSRLSSAIASLLPCGGVPLEFAERLIAFGAVHWSPIPPAIGHAVALRDELVRERGIKDPTHPRYACRRAKPSDGEVAGYGTYIRVHLQPRRFPAALRTDWSKRVVEGLDSEHYVVIDKPYGVGVPPTVDNAEENCLHMTRRVLGLEDLRITHRLDQPTSGVLVLARTKEFASYFNGLLARRDGSVRKHYKVFTRREVPRGALDEEGVLTHYARVGVRAAKSKTRTVMYDEDAEGRHVCKLRVLGSEAVVDGGGKVQGYETEVVLMTGRTHQIRAQFAAVGCPVVGDTVYDGRGEDSARYREGEFEFLEKIGLQACKMAVKDESSSPSPKYFPAQGIEFSALSDPWWRVELS